MTATEFTAAAGEHHYILSSSRNTVEHDALRELFQQQRSLAPASTERPSTGGRGAVKYFDYQPSENGDSLRLVLRNYQRGGLVAKLSRRNYVWRGLPASRAAVELGLLDHLWQQQLPVCQPFAAEVIRRGLTYQCSLLTHEISGAKTMGGLLQASELSAEHWPLIGNAIRQMHELQVYHADLNAHNIMLAENRVYLIDFDRGEKRLAGGDAWKANNLQRLHRSVVKLQQQHGFNFDPRHWLALQGGYDRQKYEQ